MTLCQSCREADSVHVVPIMGTPMDLCDECTPPVLSDADQLTAVLARRGNWAIVQGDCLEVLRTMPEHSVDAIVTDPPYFLVNGSGTGFMGAEWDSLSIDNAVAVAFFKRALVHLPSIAVVDVGRPVVQPDDPSTTARCADSSSSVVPTAVPVMEDDSAPALVITREEALALCLALSSDLIDYLRRLPTDASFAIPTSFPDSDGRNTARNVVATLRDEPGWLETATRFMSTDRASTVSPVTEEKSGPGSGSRSTSGTGGAVVDVANIAVDTTSSATTSSPGDYREIVRRITSSPCARRVIRRCTSDPATMPLISEWWHERWLQEAQRVLKPGGHLIAFGGSRSFHRLVCAAESAGFEVRDTLMFLHGQGFPKNMDIGKAIDRAAGATRPIVGTRTLTGSAAVPTKEKGGTYATGAGTAPAIQVNVTAPATEDAKKWTGWGTALKPAFEPILLARAPTNESTVAKNVLKWGTGALNIDATRVFTDWQENDRPDSWKASGHSAKPDAEKIAAPPGEGIDCHPLGRWPAHVLLSHSPDCRYVGQRGVDRELKAKASAAPSYGVYGDGLNAAPVVLAEGVESQDVYDCATDCPVRMLDEQSGDLPSGTAVRHRSGGNTFGGDNPKPAMDDMSYGDSGTASRFFQTFGPEESMPRFRYMSKPSTAEKDFGLEAFTPEAVNDGRDTPIDNPYQRGESERKNTHITVKSIALMRWLVRLVTPPDGIVLDPFAGSGTTVIAARRERFRAIGVENKEEYVAIARARVSRWEEVRPDIDEAEALRMAAKAAHQTDQRQVGLF